MKPQERIIISLDSQEEFSDVANAAKRFQQEGDERRTFKIGLSLFLAYGLEIVQEVSKYGDVLLDLKLHDTPDAVAKAVKSIALVQNPPKWVTVHSSGGTNMMASAVEQARSSGGMGIVAVTEVSSLRESEYRDTNGSPSYVLRHAITGRARMAIDVGCVGVMAPLINVEEIHNLFSYYLERPKPAIITDNPLRGAPQLQEKVMAYSDTCFVVESLRLTKLMTDAQVLVEQLCLKEPK